MKKHKQPMEVVLVSYIPLFHPDQDDIFDVNVDNLTKRIENTYDGAAKGCLWSKTEKGTLVPILVYEHAQEIFEHLQFWSENKPEEWFVCSIAQHQEAYGLALIPNFRKGVERFKVNYQLVHGYPVPSDTVYNFVFRPLHFISVHKDNHYAQIKNNFKDKMHVYIIDAKNVDLFDVSKMDLTKVIDLGEFEVSFDKCTANYIIQSIKDLYHEQQINARFN